MPYSVVMILTLVKRSEIQRNLAINKQENITMHFSITLNTTEFNSM